MNAMAEAAANAGVRIVTGDTKVVERGHGDGCYINTAGVGVLRQGISVGPNRAQVGRCGAGFGHDRRSRHGDHERARGAGIREPDPLRLRGAERNDCRMCWMRWPAVHAMRDPTRGGLASTLNEIATASNVGMEIDERELPVRTEVQSACELLGLDPVYVANEGKAVFFVAPEAAESRAGGVARASAGPRCRADRRGRRRSTTHAGGAHRDGCEPCDPAADRRTAAEDLLKSSGP